MATQTGVDLVARIVDATGAGANQVRRSLDRLGAQVEDRGSTMGRLMGANMSSALNRYLAGGAIVAAIDRAAGAGVDLLKARDLGRSWGDLFIDGIGSAMDALKQFPAAGKLGELIARIGGQDVGQGAARYIRERDANEAEQLGIDQVRKRLRRDLLSEEERRREDFSQEVGPLLRGLSPGSRGGVREELERLFQERERRIKEQEAEEERRRAAEERRRQLEEEERTRERERRVAEEAEDRRRREQERLEAEQERIRAQDAARAERRRDSLAAAEGSLADAVDSRTLGGRAAAFVQSRDTQRAQLAVMGDAVSQLKLLVDENRKLRETWEQIGVVG